MFYKLIQSVCDINKENRAAVVVWINFEFIGLKPISSSMIWSSIIKRSFSIVMEINLRKVL